MSKLLLIDGNAIMHRAFHALPPLNNTKGEIVNAVYGFFSMLLTVMGEMKPTHLVVCFDRPKPTFRQTLYVGYQQNRPKMSEDLSPQFGIVHELLGAMKATIFELDGYEADDLIGTLAAQVVHSSGFTVHGEQRTQNGESIEVIILSGDRDLLQLVNGSVRMLAPVVGVKNTILYDSEKVKEKFGVSPAQIVDYKALVGDASDGYPGVSGIGPKTASTLLQKYETLEGIYEHLGDLEGKLREKLTNGSEQAALCKRLATIVLDAPVSWKLEECDLKRLDIDGLRGAFREQGFKSLEGRLNGVFAESASSLVGADLALVTIKKKKEKEGQLELLD